jgi:hypothetical protein
MVVRVYLHARRLDAAGYSILLNHPIRSQEQRLPLGR